MIVAWYLSGFLEPVVDYQEIEMQWTYVDASRITKKGFHKDEGTFEFKCTMTRSLFGEILEY